MTYNYSTLHEHIHALSSQFSSKRAAKLKLETRINLLMNIQVLNYSQHFKYYAWGCIIQTVDM
jgi:hypothetical protein